MNLLIKADSLVQYSINLLKHFYLKLAFRNRFACGKGVQFKSTSRINIFDSNGSIEIGDRFSIGYNSELYSWNEKISIGSGTSINDNCKIYGDVSVGSNCLFASNIFISSGTHNFNSVPSLPIRVQDKLNVLNKGVIIEDDCWIGFGVVIMPGIYIGKGAIIGSNSVVTKDVFPYTINGGVPSREIGKRLDFENSYLELKSNIPEHWPFFYRGCDYKQFENTESLNDGIKVDKTSFFLIKKSEIRQLLISGVCTQKIRGKIFLNKDSSAEIELEEGRFDLNLNLEDNKNKYDSVTEFDQLSHDIKDNFHVIILKITGQYTNEPLKYILNIISIAVL